MATDKNIGMKSSPLYNPASGNASLITMPVIGVVKNNIDPTRAGRIWVYIAEWGGQDPDSKDNWIQVSYMTPFYGIAAPGGDATQGADRTGWGKYNGNPQSYGWWTGAPDIGTEVVCVFVNGKPDQGYWIGCIPQTGLHSMVPGLGSTHRVVPNATEATSYGGADRLPTSETNVSNPAIRNSPTLVDEPKPIHSYQASILFNQGVIRDNIRGVVSSSSIRETPSRVYGLSTPGGPIYEGGYTNSTIEAAAQTQDVSKLQITGRTGGHTFVLDDGTLDGRDQLIRLRTSGGHQIMMNDSGQALFILHSNGQSWIQMNREGAIDLFSTNSVNIRTQGDLNLHADRDINMHAVRNVNLYGESVNMESGKNTTFRVGTNFTGYVVGSYTLKTDGPMSFAATGQASLLSSVDTFINGANIYLNTGKAGLQPEKVEIIPKQTFNDTTYSESKGWIQPAPKPIVTVASRTPTHMPWDLADKGVDIKVSGVAPSASATAATPAIDAMNRSTPGTPETTVTPTIASPTPAIPGSANGQISSAQATAQGAQQSLSNKTKTPEQQKQDGVLPGAGGITAKQSEIAGAIKPGVNQVVTTLQAKGAAVTSVINNVVTGAAGAASGLNTLVAGVQADIIGKSQQVAYDALTRAGVVTGKESPLQIAGAIQAVAQAGTKAVGAILNGTGTVNGKSIADAVAGGKFAAQLSDKISSGIAGLQTSVSGLAKSIATGVTTTVAAVSSALQTVFTNAYRTVEASFKNLRAGAPNILGGGSVTAPLPEQNTTDRYAVAVQEVQAAEEALYAAQRQYRTNATPANLATVSAAEAALTAARSKQFGAAKAIASGTLTSLTATGPATPNAVTTATSGINVLPGGVNAVTNIVNNSLSNASSGVKSAVDSAIASGQSAATTVAAAAGIAALKNPQQLVGNLVKNVGSALDKIGGAVNSAITGTTAALSNYATAAKAKIQTALGSLGDIAKNIKAGTAASGTFDKAPLVAKAGQLLGDPKVPVPEFNDAPPNTKNVDEWVTKTQQAYKSVKQASEAVEKQKLRISTLYDRIDRGDATYDQLEPQIQQEQAVLADLEKALTQAQNQFTALTFS